jgi:hypothetical protein
MLRTGATAVQYIRLDRRLTGSRDGCPRTTTLARKIKRHPLDHTMNKQSSGAILADLKRRLPEIYRLRDGACEGRLLGLSVFSDTLTSELHRRVAWRH